MWPKKMSFDSSIILLYSANRPLPHHGEQHPGSGHHHHRQPERPGPAPGSGLRPPCKKLPQRNSLWGSFYRAGRTLSWGEQLGDWWQLRRDGLLERFRRGGCGGGAPAAAVAGITVLGPVCLVYAFLPCSPIFANTACRLPFGSTIFQTFAWCFSAQRFCGDLTGISQKHNQFACILGKA